MLKLKNEYNMKITTFLSNAGMEVTRIYGLQSMLKRISPGGYYEEIITSDKAGVSNVYSGRFNRERYQMLIVAPATSNTVAKTIYGIADTIVTNIIAQAVKGGIPILILPSDVTNETEIPCYIDRDKCTVCMDCVDKCPYNAIELIDGKPRINLMHCYGCAICVEVCPVDAIRCWEKITIKIREIDKRNIELLSNMEGINVITHPSEIEVMIEKLVLRSKT